MDHNESLAHLRHTLAHLLAAAVLKLYPDAKPSLGPAIDDGFYYDFELSKPITEADLPKIEKEMRKILPTWDGFEAEIVTSGEAKKRFAGNPYKIELIEEITKRKEPITIYHSPHRATSHPWPSAVADSGLGKLKAESFSDLCRGGHVSHPSKDIPSDSWKLDRIAGAYWRGDEKNKMLTRIYGLAFENKDALEAYEKMRADAEKYDHRKLGKELRIFTFDDDVGPGLPLWLPNGTVIIEELEKLARETETAAGYKRVRTPHIAKESMYRKSGHLPYYEESMFPPMEYEGGKYYLKAMNCPHHHKIYASEPRSYRDLPLRLAEYGTLYRHEKSGELFGLMRVRSLQMNDAHIYCTEAQFADEFRRVNDMYVKYFELFRIKKYVMRFSTHDPEKLGKKYVDEPELWKKTESMVRRVLEESKIPFIEVPNEAAFYGPKIDVQVWSAIGREFTLATNQVDFSVPKRFGLVYVDDTGKEVTPLVIHRAPLGTHERFIGFLIEHYAGSFPLWLAPEQVRILPVSEKFLDSARELESLLRGAGIRVTLDVSNEGLGKKVRSAKVSKLPYWIVVGAKEVESKQYSLESAGGKEESLDQHKILALLNDRIVKKVPLETAVAKNIDSPITPAE